MKKLLSASALALSFLLCPAAVHAQCGAPAGPTIRLPGRRPCTVSTGINFQFKCQSGGPAAQAGPWYLYWPLEAHFVQPAPTGYPYWPSPMVLPGASPALGQGAPAPVAPPPAVHPASLQRVGYQGQAPSYWFSR